MKSFRPFWSYRIEQTENWLAEQASNGKRLISMNKWTRVFTFEQHQPSERTFRLTRNKKTNLGLARLEEKGWTVDAQEKEWAILSAEHPTLFPVRDELLHRTQRHLYVWIFLVWFHMATMAPLFIAGFIVGGSVFDWIPFLILFIDAVLLIGFFYLIRKHLTFQKKEMGMGGAAESKNIGKKHYRMRLGWMYNLSGLEEWLEHKASEGLILDKVSSFYFRFVEQEPELRSYQCTFEYKVKTSFFSMYKEMGWHLHFSSRLSFLHYAIWSMAYDPEEEKPEISYVKEERLKNLKRAFRFHFGIAVYLVLLLLFSLYTNLLSADAFFEWSYMGVLRILLLVMGIGWAVNTWNIIKNYFIQKRKLLAE